jgi:serine protease Do
MAQTKKTLYDILGVARDANEADIRLAHEQRKAELERQAPPDPNAQALVHQAYEVLQNPKRRAAYDASLVTAAEKTAAAQQAPDLVLDADEKPAAPKVPWIAIAIAAAVGIVVLFFAMRPAQTPSPAPVAPAATEPPKVAEPPPPKVRSAPEILADASTSGGQLLSYSMSGQAVPIGMAISTEQGTMITTCHGIPGGTKLVVRVGKDSYPADLLITDETYDLCKLQVSHFGTPPVKLATDAPRVGDKVFAVGMNAKGESAVTEGSVRNILETTEGRMLELSFPIGQYSSGGGVFDAYGRLVGIATFQHRSGLSVALPASNIALIRSRGATR